MRSFGISKIPGAVEISGFRITTSTIPEVVPIYFSASIKPDSFYVTGF